MVIDNRFIYIQLENKNHLTVIIQVICAYVIQRLEVRPQIIAVGTFYGLYIISYFSILQMKTNTFDVKNIIMKKKYLYLIHCIGTYVGVTILFFKDLPL